MFLFEFFDEFVRAVLVSLEDVFDLVAKILFLLFESYTFLLELFFLFFKRVEFCEDTWVAKFADFLAQLFLCDLEVGDFFEGLTDCDVEVSLLSRECFDAADEFLFVVVGCVEVGCVEVEALFLFDDFSFEGCFEFSYASDTLFVRVALFFEACDILFQVVYACACLLEFLAEFFFAETS